MEIVSGGWTVTEALLLCHSLEKGMGISNVKYGYGQEKALRLIGILDELNKDSYAYQESVSVLKAYIDFQKKHNVSIKSVEEKFSALSIPDTLIPAGYEMLDKEYLENGKDFPFENFVSTRHSVRKFSDEIITKASIEQALKCAIHSPSACNRQPWKFYYTLDQDKNYELGQLVPGNKGFAEDIPYYAVVTVDRMAFGTTEAYQWYLNGGIFIANIIFAFHSLGIGTCIFQYPNFYETQADIFKLVNVQADSECICALIGFGHYSTKSKCIAAARKPVSEVGIVF